MKKVVPIVFLIFSFCFFSACEKDDICVDGDTPFLIIGFFDIDDAETKKETVTLRIREINVSEIVDYDPNDESERRSYHSDRSTTDSTAIPLNVTTAVSTFEFINNSADDADTGEETGNIDTLTFNYTVVEKFISRACGFVANYDDLSFNLTADTDNWIQNVIIEDTIIENSSNIHVKIYH